MKNRRTSKSATTRATWTQQKEALLKKHFPTASWPDLLKMLKGHTRAGINSKARLLGLSRPNHWHLAKIEREAEKEVAKNDERNKLVSFLSKARTEREIESKFGKIGLKELKALAAEVPEGFRLKDARNCYQETTWYLERKLQERDLKVRDRIFEMLHSENDPDYLAILFPPELDFTKEKDKNALRIFPMDSVFFGDYLCDTEALDKYLAYLEKKPYAFAFLNGDIIGGSNYDDETALQIREDFKRRLAPVAHKILWAQSGPLERRMSRIDGVDPLQDVCRELGIHHTDRPVRTDVYWKFPRKPITFYAIHGRSQAKKDGSKLNYVLPIAQTQNFPHFTVAGAMKEAMAKPVTVRRLDPINFRVKEHPAYIIICPSFLRYEGSEEEKKGQPPPSTGTVVCIIGADNSHSASS